jgi:hypothetical protein
VLRLARQCLRWAKRRHSIRRDSLIACSPSTRKAYVVVATSSRILLARVDSDRLPMSS